MEKPFINSKLIFYDLKVVYIDIYFSLGSLSGKYIKNKLEII